MFKLPCPSRKYRGQKRGYDRQTTPGNDDNVNVVISGQYEIKMSQAAIDEMQIEHTVTVVWLTENFDKNINQTYLLSKDLV
jgi:hypothetical protein